MPIPQFVILTTENDIFLYSSAADNDTAKIRKQVDPAAKKRLWQISSEQAEKMLHLALVPTCPATENTPHQQQVAAQTDEYIRTHLGEDLTIDYIAQQLHVSSTTLKRSFRTIRGESIHRVVTRYRMEYAAQLLRTTGLTIIQVAAEVGYESSSQFSVIFRRTYGTSPSSYRRESRSESEQN